MIINRVSFISDYHNQNLQFKMGQWVSKNIMIDID